MWREAAKPRRSNTPTVVVLSFVVITLCLPLKALAQQGQLSHQNKQRNAYLDLWKNVFDVLPADTVDQALTSLEDSVTSPSAEKADASDTKHALLELLDSKRKERRTASLRKGIASQHGRIFGSGSANGKTPRFRQIGIPVDNARFDSKLCFRMQNLGNIDGYNGLVSSSPSCDGVDGVAVAASMMTWKRESSFTIDCTVGVSPSIQNITESSTMQSTIRAALGVGYGDSLQEPSFHPPASHASCTFAVVSQNENSHKPGAAMLKLEDTPLLSDHAIDVAPLNAVQIRLCNLPSAWSVSPNPSNEPAPTNKNTSPEFTLSTVRLNGKRLTTDTLPARRLPTCTTHLYRVPSVGLSSDGFVLSGSLKIDDAVELRAGTSSSVELAFGTTTSWASTED
jgi:hypothetical protein